MAMAGLVSQSSYYFIRMVWPAMRPHTSATHTHTLCHRRAYFKLKEQRKKTWTEMTKLKWMTREEEERETHGKLKLLLDFLHSILFAIAVFSIDSRPIGFDWIVWLVRVAQQALFCFYLRQFSFGRWLYARFNSQIDFRLMALSLWHDMWPALELLPFLCLDFCRATSIWDLRPGETQTWTTTDGVCCTVANNNDEEHCWITLAPSFTCLSKLHMLEKRYVHVRHGTMNVYRFQFTCWSTNVIASVEQH